MYSGDSSNGLNRNIKLFTLVTLTTHIASSMSNMYIYTEINSYCIWINWEHSYLTQCLFLPLSFWSLSASSFITCPRSWQRWWNENTVPISTSRPIPPSISDRRLLIWVWWRRCQGRGIKNINKVILILELMHSQTCCYSVHIIIFRKKM